MDENIAPQDGRILVRYKDPQRLDNAPYGQIWKVIGDNDIIDIWVQISKFEVEPCWIPITNYFDKNFQELLEDPEFLDAVRSLFPLLD